MSKQCKDFGKNVATGKYHDATNSNVIVKWQYQGTSCSAVEFFREGDFGLIVAPPATRDLALTLAMATGSKTDIDIGIMVPKLNDVIYIDDAFNVKPNKTYQQNIMRFAQQYQRNNFTIVDRPKIDEIYCKKNRLDKNNFTSMANFIEAHDSVDGVFIRLGSFIDSSSKFPKKDFDKIIEWALRMKKKGKTVVFVCDYLPPHADCITKDMNFVINLIPHEIQYFTNVYYCNVQWLKYEKTNTNVGGESESSSNNVNSVDTNISTSKLNFDDKMPYFTMARSTANRGLASGWYVQSYK
jgi:hypothetical protein